MDALLSWRELLEQQPAAMLLVLAAGLAVSLATSYYHRRAKAKPTTAKVDLEKKTAAGDVFVTPTPPPYPGWSLEHTKPLPYRPFRHGPNYFITMGLRKLPWESWIELDNEFLSFHAQKAARIVSQGSRCCMTAPEAFPAACELLDELARYLPARYPSLFRRTPVGLDNIVTGESFNVIERPLVEDPMQMAARLVQDDLAIILPSSPEEGGPSVYRLKAGATLLTGFWRLEDKYNMTLDEIHESGDVPGYQTKLKRGMNNFMGRLRPEEAVARNNYFIQVDDELAWSSSIGSEDSDNIGWWSAKEAEQVTPIHFRSERQSLRRLPKSGGILFTIRTYFCPVTELAKEPFVPGRLASAIRSWGEDVSKYKGKDKYEKVLLEFLDYEHERQVRDGLEVEKEEEEVKYPW